MDHHEWKQKIAIVTGGSNGIGNTIAREFASKGAIVALIDTDREQGEKLIRELPGENHLFYAGDLCRENDLDAFACRILSKYGHLDYLVNNACFTRKGILSGCSYDDFNNVLKAGVTAPYMLSRYFMDHFAPGGAIVNISSTRAFMSQKDTESYTAAKGGITALTHALSMSLADKGIRVNSISPGWIDTGSWNELSREDHLQHPSRRVGIPRDIAHAVLFLCSTESSFINGQNMIIDGGMSKQMIYHGDEGWSLTRP